MAGKNAALRPVVGPELREWVDNRLVSAHVRIVKPMVLGTLLNAAVIIAALYGQVGPVHLALFGASVVAAAFHRLWLAEGIARARRQKRPGKMKRAFFYNSLWLGANLGCLLALHMSYVSIGAQILLAVCAVTQIASAAYTVRTLPLAATIYILTQTLGLSMGLAQSGGVESWGTQFVLLAASGLMIRMAYTAHDLFVTRILSDRELAASTRTVKLLLNEYQESGSDWLFELNGEDRMVGVSARFADAAGQLPSMLEGKPFARLFAAGRDRDDVTATLIERRPLRNAVLRLAHAAEDGSKRWWSISGRPCNAGVNERVTFRGVISDVTTQRQAESRVHHMAHYDSLTGLPNRVLFGDALTGLIDDGGEDVRAALMLIDIDHFKSVNDMYGHPTGDAFLRAVAQRLTDTVDDSGLGGSQHLVARLGGDEFAVVIACDDACDHAIRLAEKLVESAKEPVRVEDHEIACGISIGIALSPHHAVLKQQLMSNADIALYAAKNGGRGMWEMFTPGMDAALHERHTLARDMRYAVPNGELRLFVQPLVDVETETMTGYEALLRWQHPERGLIPPDVFIPIAEETGLIVPIGEWVIRTAFAEAASWPGKQLISINLSPVQLGSSNLLPVIVQALAEHQLDPGRVEFEITEGVLLHNSEANIEVLNRLHSFGVKIALDDFGTGYASLNYLLTFPFDKIKIDRRFVSELATREESRAIVGAVISLANELGMCTLAEGVEEPDQFAHLRAHGCRMVQGWLFGKALPSEAYHPRAEAQPVVNEPHRLRSARPVTRRAVKAPRRIRV